MMDFITHGLWHCVLGVDKDSDVMGVSKGSGYGTCLRLISFHDMEDFMVKITFLLKM